MKQVEIQITYDFICPWCWIGHKNLEKALGVDDSGASFVVSYLPYELNPTLPAAGVDRREYRTRKFGTWQRSQAMDGDVTTSGKRVGLDFDYDRVKVTPNTLLAHRLMAFARRAGDALRTGELFNAIFEAYFSRGENIGDVSVLEAVAVAVGFDGDEVRAFLLSDQGKAEVLAYELDGQESGINSVPMIQIGSRRIQGAQPASVLLHALDSVTGASNANGDTCAEDLVDTQR
ncbi:disulfide bond formation protein DsbA [Paraburkholderia phytofirmans OLGA172]|uniref:Disulfide bond formation protein DsbA n=1 Tax=Paraburkholderia phytofirmans OLGA172 TaxID=1417228 RepID=A0A160FTI8_9BURK|nr:DsbA family oxidoreductase [Paraburkholderia phytofirmans]ANB76489.1 disulfide bond formation protein DsbA [Paraburkholderia phytofirmans OLGA172]